MTFCPVCTHRMTDLQVSTNIVGMESRIVGSWCPMCGLLSFGGIQRPMALSLMSIDELIQTVQQINRTKGERSADH